MELQQQQDPRMCLMFCTRKTTNVQLCIHELYFMNRRAVILLDRRPFSCKPCKPCKLHVAHFCLAIPQHQGLSSSLVLVSILAVTHSSLFLFYCTSSMLHAHSSQVDLAACTLCSLISNKQPSLHRTPGNICSAHACRPLYCPLFKICMTVKSTIKRMERRLLKCTETQV